MRWENPQGSQGRPVGMQPVLPRDFKGEYSIRTSFPFSFLGFFEFSIVFQSTPCKHPVIVLQDVAYTDLHALVEFIYHGEVNVHQRSLSSFLKTAEVLRVSGLTQNEDAQGVSNLFFIPSVRISE